MTPEEFIAEAKRRGLPKEETRRRYDELMAAGAFAPAQSASNAGQPPQGWRGRADAMIPNALSEYASAANRAVTETLDFLGPGAVNAGLSLAGSNRRIPTFTQGLDAMGGRGGFMPPGAARDTVRAAGALTTAAGGMAPVARQAGTVASTVADLVGAGSSAVGQAARPAIEAADYAVSTLQDAMPTMPRRVTRAMRDAELPLKRMEGTADTFGYQLNRAGEVIRDPRQAAAAKQGVDERVVTMVRDAPPKARENMRRMLDVVEQSRKDALFEARNRPSDIVGEAITKRTRAILAGNRTAAMQLDKVAQSLKGQPVDVQPAMQRFLDDISSMGVQFDPATGKVNYAGSDIEKVKGPMRFLNNVIDRLYNSGKAPDAYDVHRMKRFIDEQVAYGKSKGGLSGRAEGIVKSLRHNLDSILDQQFPEYNRVNTNYSETIQALNALQDAAGKRIDLTGKNAETALGTLSRRVLGNVVTRQELINSLDQVDAVARKVVSGQGAGRNVVPYRPGFISDLSGVKPDDLDDSLIGQIRFVSELESIFGTNAKNSFLGDIAKATDRTAESLAVGDKTGPIREGARMAINRVRGINEENALKALRALLND